MSEDKGSRKINYHRKRIHADVLGTINTHDKLMMYPDNFRSALSQWSFW